MGNKILCDIRKNSSKGNNHRLRANGKIPGIIYGLHGSNLNVELAEFDLLHALSEIGDHGVVEIDTNGNCERVMVKDVQREPITRRLLHVDLQRFDENKRVHSRVPLLFKGESILKSRDNTVIPQFDNIEVEGVPQNLPKYVMIDVSNMELGRKITCNDIEISKEISIVGDLNTIIATISKIKNQVQLLEKNDSDDGYKNNLE